MTASEPQNTSASGRDIRIDIVRGLALICIYIDHAPGNALAAVTLKAFGLCDASEVFVLISGMAAALAYKRLFERDRGGAVQRVVKRIVSIYVAQIAIAAASVSVLLAAAYLFKNQMYFGHSTLAMLPASWLQAVVGIVTLTLQPGYLHILPLYVILLSALPAILRLREYHPLLPLGLSLLVWAAAQGGMNLPAIGESGWYFNPFGWQLLFTIGVVWASAEPSARSRFIMTAATSMLLFSFLVAAPWRIVPTLMDFVPIDPSVIGSQNKHILPPLRLLNVLALAYVAIHLVPAGSGLLDAALAQAVACIGRWGLLCFCVATILDEWLVVWRFEGGRGVGYQLTVNVGGILVLWLCARAASRYSRARRGFPAGVGGSVRVADAAKQAVTASGAGLGSDHRLKSVSLC